MSIIRRILEKFIIGNKLFNKMSDEKYLKMIYKIELNEKLNLSNPQTFNEKMQWLKLYDRKDIYTTMVDKYEVKKYVSETIGEEYTIPTIGIYDKFDDIDFNSLPNQFVLKCTHDSGSTFVCKDKNQLDIKKINKNINKKLKQNFFYNFREWPYKNVKSRIIIEEYIEGMNDDLKDYKFMCFNGKVKYIFVCSNRHSKTGLNINIFDTEWNLMPFGRLSHPNSKENIKKPENLERMIELSEKLAKDHTFIRVDFYENNKTIYFGELTFYPSAGFENFEPIEWNKKLGEMLVLPKEKIEEKEHEK